MSGSRLLETAKEMSNFWPKEWSLSLQKFKKWTLTREFLKQYFTEKQNGYFQSGRLMEVVAYERDDCPCPCPP